MDTSDAPTLVSWLLQAVRLGRLLGSTHSTGRRWEISSARVGHAPHPGSRPTATGTRAAGAKAARSRRHRQLFNFLIDETALYRNHNISLCDCAMRISHICRAARSRSDRGHPYKLDIIALAERPSPCGVWDSELGLTRPALGADYYLTSLTSVKHREDRLLLTYLLALARPPPGRTRTPGESGVCHSGVSTYTPAGPATMASAAMLQKRPWSTTPTTSLSWRAASTGSAIGCVKKRSTT